MTKFRKRAIGIAVCAALIAAAILLLLAYRYHNPRVVHMSMAPFATRQEGEAAVEMLSALRLGSMMESFGIAQEDYEVRDRDSDAYITAFVSLEQSYEIRGENTAAPMVLIPRQEENRAILLWQNEQAINYCYWLQMNDEDERYEVSKISRAFGTRYEMDFSDENNG